MSKRFSILMIGILFTCLLPWAAYAQDWQSTSTMRTSGSTYVPQVTAVGATTAYDMTTTTANYSPASGGPYKAPPINPRPGDNPVPIGDAILPLLLMALTFVGITYTRRKKAEN